MAHSGITNLLPVLHPIPLFHIQWDKGWLSITSVNKSAVHSCITLMAGDKFFHVREGLDVPVKVSSYNAETLCLLVPIVLIMGWNV